MEDPTFLPTAATTATTTGEGNPVSSVTNNISDEGDDEDDEFGEFADAVTSTQEGDSTTNGIQVVEADAEDYSNNSDTSIGLEEYEDAVDDEGAAVAAAQLPIEIDKVPSITTTTTMMDNIASTTDEFMKLSDESLGDSVDPVVVAAAAMAMASATKDSGGTATSTIAAATTATVSCSSRTEEGADDNNNNSRDTVVPAASAVTRNDKLQPHQQQLQWSYSDDATTSYKGVHDDDVVVGGLDTTTGNAFPVNAATDVDIDDELGDGVHDGKMASATAPASPDISIPVKIQDNDDFGDFDSANPAVKGVADAKAAVFEAEVIANGDEDDFGDFGDAVPPVEEAASTKAAAAPEDDDDDFGDFGDASPPIGEIANAATADEEDFGDFGGAQIVPLHPEDDDDNDFGDFDGGDFGAEAPSASLNVDEDDFGNFDKAPTESSAAAQLTVFPDSGGDPILDKLRLVFPKLFARYNDIPDGGDDESVTDKDETVGDTSSPVHDIAVTVQSVLTPLITQAVSHCVHATSSVLDQLFQDTSMFTESASICIVAEGGKGPLAHTSYPIGGFYSTSTGARLQFQNQIEHALSGSLLPDVVRVPLPAAKESLSSPNDRFSPPNLSEDVAAVTMVNHLPPHSNINADPAITVASPTETEQHEPSEQAKNFLRRIPDLSYMLSSKLSIPNKR